MHRLSCVGLVLAAALLTWGCGDDSGTKTCGPNSCSGCCTSTGKCITSPTVNFCGKGGGLCSQCQSNEQCTNGSCSGGGACNSGNCASGCCQNGQCMGGDTNAACGKGGGSCTPCDTGKTCSNGSCIVPACDANTNPNGCCYNGVAFPGDNPSLCGKGGQVCQPCQTNQSCTNHQCVAATTCNATTCASGCCQNGACQPGNGINACGKGGNNCQQCNAGQVCSNQTCINQSCNASTCPNGCCDKNGNCVAGNSEPACGKGGVVCTTCGTNQQCQNQACVAVTPTCTASTCPAGCCDKNNVCQPGNLSALCGKGGAACAVCGTGQECFSQKCSCTTTSCSKGCCAGDTCKAGNDLTACGAGGNACKACTGTDKCMNQVCQTDCSFLTCYGCCDSSKVCHDPPNDTNCGYFGYACTTCSGSNTCDMWGGVCNDTSKCSTSNCKGCCKNGACQTGNQDSACGEGGYGCEVCGGTVAPQLYCGTDTFTLTRECIATPASNWDVLVGMVETKTGVDWDDGFEGGDPPELYVKVTVTSQNAKTPTAPEGYTADFNSAYMFTAKASDLTTKIHFEIYDNDSWSGDDLIISCDDVIYPSELKLYAKKITSCASDPNNANFISITFKFKAK